MQWVTLFDHPDDDIYDGILGEDDDEVPRIKLDFMVEDAQGGKGVSSPVGEVNLPKLNKQQSSPQSNIQGRGSIKAKPGAATPHVNHSSTFNNRPSSGRVTGGAPGVGTTASKRSNSSAGFGAPTPGGAQSSST